MANATLVKLLHREREEELAKVDYVTYSILATSPAADQKTLDAQIGAIAKIRKATAEVLNGSAYNPIILAQRKEAEEKRQTHQSDMLDKVASFDESL